MPANFQFPARDVQFWAPLATNPHWLERPAADSNKVRSFYARWSALARLKPGVSVERAQTEMSVLARRLSERAPDTNRGLGLTAVPLHVEVSGNTRLALSILLAAVSFLLMIACVNAAHLILAHGANRKHEMAVRLSLGARRADVLRQLVTESVVVSLCAGFCGVLLALAGVRALVAFAPSDVPRLEQATVNGEVLCFALGVSFLGAIVSGVLPAWKRVAVLRRPRQARPYTAYLVVAEVALTVVLLTGAGL